MKRFPKIIAFVTAACLLLAGCGSNGEDFAYTPVTDVTPEQVFTSHLFLGAAVENVPITLQRLDGTVVSTQTTDSSGNAYFLGSLPVDFRLVAQLENGLEFSSEVRGAQNLPYATINVPTTVVSQLVQSGSSLEAAQAQTRALLQLPEGFGFDIVDESVGMPFSHLAFFGRAAENGGVDGSLTQLAANAPFLLRKNTVDLPLSGLPPALEERLLEVRNNPDLRTSLDRLLSRGLQTPSEQLNLATINPQVGEVAVGVVIAKKIAAGAVKGISSAGFVWLSQQMGWHVGFKVKIVDIYNDMQDLENDFAAMKSDYDKGLFQTGFQATEDSLQKVNDGFGFLYTAIINFNNLTDAQSNEYFSDKFGENSSPDQSIQTAAQSVAALVGWLEGQNSTNNSASYDPITEMEAALQIFAQWLTGTRSDQLPSNNLEPIAVRQGYVKENNMIWLAQQFYLQDGYGIYMNTNDVGRFMNMPVRTQKLMDQVLGVYERYGKAQLTALMLLGESIHQLPSINIDSETPYSFGGEITDYILQVEKTMESLASQRAQLPGYPPQSRVFIDLQNGLMWYMDVQGSTYFNNAHFATKSVTLEDGHTYSDWRLPSYNEALTLQDRGAYAYAAQNNLSSVNYHHTIDGLKLLGFNTDGINSDGDIWAADWQYDNGVFGSHQWEIHDDLEVRLNHSGVDDSYRYQDDTQRPFFFVRSIAGPTIKIRPPNSIGGEDDSWPAGFSHTVQHWEMPWIGVITSLDGLKLNDGLTFGWVSAGLTVEYRVGDLSYQIGAGGSDTKGTHRELGGGFHGSIPDGLPPLYYTSSNRNAVTVSSIADDAHDLTYHADLNNTGANITAHATAWDPDSNTFPYDASASVYVPPRSKRYYMDELEIEPINPVISLLTGGSGDTKGVRFTSTGYFEDDTVVDFTDIATWTVVDTNTDQPVAGATFSQSDRGLLLLERGTLTSEYLTVRAVVDGNQDHLYYDKSATVDVKVQLN